MQAGITLRLDKIIPHIDQETEIIKRGAASSQHVHQRGTHTGKCTGVSVPHGPQKLCTRQYVAQHLETAYNKFLPQPLPGAAGAEEATAGREHEESSYKVINEANENDDNFVDTEQNVIKVEEVQLEKCPSPAEHNDPKRSSPAAAVQPVPLKKKSISTRVLPSTSDKGRRRSCHFVPIISFRSYENILRLLKLLDELVLLDENYRAIGLLSQLEKIFEDGITTSASKEDLLTHILCSPSILSGPLDAF